MNQFPKIYAHPRSGLNWAHETISRVFYPEMPKRNITALTGHWAERVNTTVQRTCRTKKRHSFYKDQKNCIYVIRDGRDVAVSQWRTKGFQHPKRRNRSFSEFLTDELDWEKTPGHENVESELCIVQHWYEHIRGWEQRPSVFYLRYEDLMRTPIKVLESLGSWLNRKVRDLPSDEPAGPFPAKEFKIRKWIDVFSEDDLEYFFSIVPHNFWGLYTRGL